MLVSPSPSSQQVLPVGKQSHQWFALHLFFLGETQSQRDVVGCDQVSEVRPIPCTKLFTIQAIGDLPGAILGQELSPLLRVDS